MGYNKFTTLILINHLMQLSLRYADTLIKQRAEALVSGQEFLTWNDVQKCIDTVNIQVHEEHERKKVLQISVFICCCMCLVLINSLI